MRDRYERIFSLPRLLYITGSPVIIEAGALLKDNQNNGVVAQLKFKNISDNNIKALTVIIYAYDTAQRPLGEPVVFQYLDLSAKRDDSFGQSFPIVLSASSARAFSVSVKEVVFDNNEIWNNGEKIWSPIPAAVPLNDFFNDQEMTKQFKIHYGFDSSVCPIQIGDLWYCTCEKINHTNELTCHSCGKKAGELFYVDLSFLTREKEERLKKEAWEKQLAEQKATAERKKKEAEEKAERERIAIEREKAEKKAHAKRIRIFIALGIIIGIFIAFQTISSINKGKKYQAAEQLLSNKQYEDAIAAFSELTDYRDSPQRILEAYYIQGIENIASLNYASARKYFEAASNYKDAKTQVKQTYYLEGISFVNEKKYSQAMACFEKSDPYEDSSSYYYYCKLKLSSVDNKSDLSSFIDWIDNVTLTSLKKEIMSDPLFSALLTMNGCWSAGRLYGLTILAINNARITERKVRNEDIQKTTSYRLKYYNEELCYGDVPSDCFCTSISGITKQSFTFYHYSYGKVDLSDLDKDVLEFTPSNWRGDKFCK